MKYKKHLLFLLIVSILNCLEINTIYADKIEYYYKTGYGDYGSKLTLSRDTDNNTLILTIDGKIVQFDSSYIVKYPNNNDYPGVILYDENNVSGGGKKAYFYDNAYTSATIKNYTSYKENQKFTFSEMKTIKTDDSNESNESNNYCYYTGNAALKIKFNEKKPKKSQALVDKWGLHYYNSNHETVLNWNSSPSFAGGNAPLLVNSYTGEKCPTTIAIVKQGGLIKQFYVYANPQSEINNWCQDMNKLGYCYVYYGTYQPGMTEEQYNDFLYGKSNQSIVIGENDDSSCSDIFGSIGKTGYIKYAKDSNGQYVLDNFGNKIIEEEVSPSLGYIIYQTLSIARIIAIVLVIFLGILDFAKSVLAGKEDEMRKNQQRFVKRLIMCVAIFLVPTIVSIIMNLVDEKVTLSEECLNASYEIIK